MVKANQLLQIYRPEAWSFIESWASNENQILKVHDDYSPTNIPTATTSALGKGIGM